MITTAIIDDNLVFRKLTKVLLKQSGIKEDNILLFSNGKEMYDYMQQHSNNVNILPNIIFSGYTVNPNATMKIITSISFLIVGIIYLLKSYHFETLLKV